MTIEQTVTIPADYRLLLELPRSVPSGIKAQVKINIPVVSTEGKEEASFTQPSLKIDEIRQLLQKEMVDKGTLTITAASGDGWEAYVRERHAES